MEPIVSGLTHPDQQQGPMQARVCITLEDYLTHLRAIVVSQNTQTHSQTTGSTKAQLWISMVAAIRRKQRAYGTRQALALWIEKRGMRSLEQALSE